jgi:hypothetical protein
MRLFAGQPRIDDHLHGGELCREVLNRQRTGWRISGGIDAAIAGVNGPPHGHHPLLASGLLTTGAGLHLGGHPVKLIQVDAELVETSIAVLMTGRVEPTGRRSFAGDCGNDKNSDNETRELSASPQWTPKTGN